MKARPSDCDAVLSALRARPHALPFPKQYDLPFSRVQLLEDRLDVPLRTRKPTCYFVDSMADLFHEDVPDEFIDKVWGSMYSAHRHRFLILTKRPERMREYLSRFVPTPPEDGWITRDGVPSNKNGRAPIYRPDYWPLPNVWLGTSVEDQAAADARIRDLWLTPAAVRFLSCEPLIGPIDLRAALAAQHIQWGHDGTHRGPCGDGPHHHHDERCARPFDWVIVGGESGSRARPMDLAWARSLVEQCKSAGVPMFVKQLGSKPVERMPNAMRGEEIVEHAMTGFPGSVPVYRAIRLRDSHGRMPEEWPKDLRVRDWPR